MRGLWIGLRAALLGLELGLRSPEVRGSYGRLLGAALLVSLATDAAGIWAITHFTAVDLQAEWWVALSFWVLRWLGIAAVVLATPLIVLVSTRLALPLLAEQVFLAGLRALDPARAQRMEGGPSLPLWRSALDSMIRLTRFAGLTIALLLLALIPGVGPIVAGPLQLYFTARALTWELLDPYFERGALRLRAQREFVAEHRMALLGFGLPLALLLAIPLLGPLLFGLAQAAVAQLVHDALPELTGGRVVGPRLPGGSAPTGELRSGR